MNLPSKSNSSPSAENVSVAAVNEGSPNDPMLTIFGVLWMNSVVYWIV